MMRQVKLADYELEEFLRCPHKYVHKHEHHLNQDHLNWRQLVQYAVNHAIHDYYSLPPESRTAAGIRSFLERQWTNKVRLFESFPHFHRVKAMVTEHLVRELTSLPLETPPILLFESISAWIDELRAEISLIVQLAYWSGESYTIRKFMVGEDPAVIPAFFHMTSVMAHRAFGKLPEQIEVVTLLTGQKQTYRPQDEELEASIDYLRLASRLFQEKTVHVKREADYECTACPFTERCPRGTESISAGARGRKSWH